MSTSHTSSQRTEAHTLLASQTAKCRRCLRSYTRVHIGTQHGRAPDYCDCGTRSPLSYTEEEWITPASVSVMWPWINDSQSQPEYADLPPFRPLNIEPISRIP